MSAGSESGFVEYFVDRLRRERPGGGGFLAWLWSGMQRHGLSFAVALVVTWGGLWGLIFFVFLGALLGAIGGLVLAVFAPVFDQLPQGLAPTLATGGLFGGALTGATALPAALFGGAVLSGFGKAILANSLPGLLVAVAILALMVLAERPMLEVRGARRMSRREVERVGPLVEELCRGWDLEGRPTVLVSDSLEVGAHAHARHLVLTRGLMEQLDDAELCGVLAHELHHWRRGDAVGLAFVWACALPLVLLYNALVWLAELGGFVALVVWALAWPFLLSVRLLVAPVVGLFSRRHEYEADEAAARSGHGEGLYRALEQMREVEPGRSGWEKTVAATHPPTELRLEAIEDAMRQQPAVAQAEA